MRGKIWKCRSLFPLYAPPLWNKDASRATGHGLCQLLRCSKPRMIFFTVYRLESVAARSDAVSRRIKTIEITGDISFLLFQFKIESPSSHHPINFNISVKSKRPDRGRIFFNLWELVQKSQISSTSLVHHVRNVSQRKWIHNKIYFKDAIRLIVPDLGHNLREDARRGVTTKSHHISKLFQTIIKRFFSSIEFKSRMPNAASCGHDRLRVLAAPLSAPSIDHSSCLVHRGWW